MNAGDVGPEQVSVERLIDRAWADFDMRLTSIHALYVVWGSLNGVDDLVRRYFVAKGESELLDKRRRRTEQQADRYFDVLNRAESAVRYLEWARSNEGQPILQDALVGYVSAFECALKAIAIAFQIAALPSSQQKQHFIPSKRFLQVVKGVENAWRAQAKSRQSECPTAQAFFQSEIFAKVPHDRDLAFESTDSEVAPKYGMSPRQSWSQVGEAFHLRNAIVHSNGRLSQQVELGREVFRPGDALRLTTITLTAVEACFRAVLNPINPNQL